MIDKIREIIKTYIGTKDVGVYYIDLTKGEHFGVNEDKMYYAASIAKLPSILYTQQKLNNKIIKETDKYTYFDYINNIPGAMIRGGTGILQNIISEGDAIDVKTLLRTSSSESDNLASNMLSYYICHKNSGEFKNYISQLIGRNLEEFKKEFTAKEGAIFMEHIYREGGLAIEYLKNTSWDNIRIPKYIPVKCAHKIGINGEYNHDVGVVYCKSPYVVSIMTKGESDEFISRISEIIYNCINKG